MHEVEVEALEGMVARALDELPTALRERLDNLAIVVEDAATGRDCGVPLSRAPPHQRTAVAVTVTSAP